ncbi:hypothetical protein AA313_de0208867 [Arthrobotrys entomopaga]|nr:hypothetical protein AA313_de0208867 [Arthrobotrys entomopaga]
MDLLPVELQQHIITLLDPIALISLSQCNRRFRHLINPDRRERVEKLLARECHDVNGGGIPLHKIAWEGTFEVDWSLDKWEAHRWACTNCQRLLPHTEFDNHSILGLAYRKPAQGTPACTDFKSSWTPSLRGKKWGRKVRLAKAKEKRDTKDANEEYEDWFPPNDYRCEYRRWRRHCNECRYILHELRPQLSHWDGVMGGTHKVPILRSRLLEFESTLERWFPGLADVLENKPPESPPRITRHMNWGIEYELWTMYMMRCQLCERWQELRSFRFGGTFVNWKPAHNGHGIVRHWTTLSGDTATIQLDMSFCNDCYAWEYGREALADALWEWFKTPCSFHRWNIECRLKMPLCKLEDRGFKIPGFEKEMKQMLREAESHRQRASAFEPLSYSDVAAIKLHHHHFVILWEKIKAVHPELAAEVDDNKYFYSWVYRYHQDEAHWRWMAAAEREIKENPSLLVDWALNRDGASLK